ncbi:hypothetical protein Bhyg_06919 [Pseudolycoriella hygida]|uniref:MSP domain-containing protein n=1 Tax=Pseudolycoriella hygida TaxID=35572 RepID=A0A9Q0N1R0_9DIPT|nr:hypothetical protein Bhyg_06919 [Pseudolycoriella hygida]
MLTEPGVFPSSGSRVSSLNIPIASISPSWPFPFDFFPTSQYTLFNSTNEKIIVKLNARKLSRALYIHDSHTFVFKLR